MSRYKIDIDKIQTLEETKAVLKLLVSVLSTAVGGTTTLPIPKIMIYDDKLMDALPELRNLLDESY